MSNRVKLRAPELRLSTGWINTGGKPLTLKELRGKIVILDFWTFCCINCLHVLDELRSLEEKYADVLVVIGVHSPKFVHEADFNAVSAAVDRYAVEHPVVNDPDLLTWQDYAARAWPTLVVIDPDGYIVSQNSGEGHAHALDILMSELIAEHEAKGTLNRGSGVYVPSVKTDTLLRYPAKVIERQNTLLVADAARHRIAVMDESGEKILQSIGSTERGFLDGSFETARFSEPNGLCELPDEIAKEVGYQVVVADTVNHALRGIDLENQRVLTLAGTGIQWMQGDGPEKSANALSTPMSSPWDVVWWERIGKVVIAMAGIHQIWTFDPLTKEVEVFAGTTNEGLVDGECKEAWFAQTSGLVISNDGETLWMADSETSSIRRIRNGVVHSEVGRGLFDFGFIDGLATEALLQHPLGLCILPDESIAIADTYNNAIRRFDPETKRVSTLAQELSEPSGLLVVKRDGRNVLLVVESAQHQLTFIQIPDQYQQVSGSAYKTKRPAQRIKPGQLDVNVIFTPPNGQKLDDRYGPATHLVISASPVELITDGSGSYLDLSKSLEIADLRSRGITTGVLHISVRAASCDDDPAIEFPACHIHQQDWGVPISLDDEGDSTLNLFLAGNA
jgi:thiol-disulfide isomerase/thioredoxin